jgi:hypothetical protein
MTRIITREAPDHPAITKFNNKFSLPQRPDEQIPTIPFDLDDMSDSKLMESYAKFMAWVSFAKAELVKSEIDEDKESNTCRVLEARVLIEQWGADAKGDRVTIAKARRDVDTRVVDQQEKYQVARAYRKLIETMFESCERGAQLLSRELSRRIGLHSKEQRTSRFGA